MTALRPHRIPGRLLRDLTPGQYRALAAVVALCRCDRGTVDVACRTLAASLGMTSPASAAKALRGLVAAGVLEVITPGTVGPNGSRRATTYRLTWVIHRVPNPGDKHGLSAPLSAPGARSQSAPGARTLNTYGVHRERTAPAYRPAGPSTSTGRTDAQGCYHPAWCGCLDCSDLRADVG